MPSLTKIFGFAAIAFAAFATAAPTVVENNVIQAREASMDIVERAPSCTYCVGPNKDLESLPGLLIKAKVDLKVEVDLLAGITKGNCTPTYVKPIVTRLVVKLEALVANILLLVKLTLDEILFNGRGRCSVLDLSNLICDIVITVLTAVGVVLRLLGGVKGEVYALLCLVGAAVSRLIFCILEVVVSLVAQIVVILCLRLVGCFWIIVALDLKDLCVLLKITL